MLAERRIHSRTAAPPSRKARGSSSTCMSTPPTLMSSMVAAAITHLALGAPPASAAATIDDIRVGGVDIHVELEPRAFRDGGAAAREWIRRSASIVSGYYGRFPTTRLTVRVIAEAGDGVHGGKSFANPDALIRVQVGREVSGTQLLADWVLVHEMTHLALPDTGEE